jgi:hypothetical protein
MCARITLSNTDIQLSITAARPRIEVDVAQPEQERYGTTVKPAVVMLVPVCQICSTAVFFLPSSRP